LMQGKPGREIAERKLKTFRSGSQAGFGM